MKRPFAFSSLVLLTCVDADRLAGLVPFSGQCITHFTVRAERGIKDTQPVVDDLAPLSHVRKDAPRLVLITSDRNVEMLGRYEVNAYLWRMMKLVGHPATRNSTNSRASTTDKCRNRPSRCCSASCGRVPITPQPAEAPGSQSPNLVKP
jgi:hypothetical protein